MNTSTARRGLILFGHGSRDPLWHRPMQSVAERVQALSPDTAVRCAYLELTTPDLPTAVDALVAEGLHALTIVPMFLGVGRHAREDLPRMLDDLRQRHPRVDFELRDAVGEDARVLDLLARVALDAG